MAASYRLSMVFNTSSGDKTFSYNYADPEMEASTVKAAANAIIENGSIFENVPTALKSAYITMTEKDYYDIS